MPNPVGLWQAARGRRRLRYGVGGLRERSIDGPAGTTVLPGDTRARFFVERQIARGKHGDNQLQLIPPRRRWGGFANCSGAEQRLGTDGWRLGCWWGWAYWGCGVGHGNGRKGARRWPLPAAGGCLVSLAALGWEEGARGARGAKVPTTTTLSAQACGSHINSHCPDRVRQLPAEPLGPSASL